MPVLLVGLCFPQGPVTPGEIVRQCPNEGIL